MSGYDIFDVLAFFLVLTPIVIIHELGHFIAAIRNNIRVEEFGLGLPPRAAKLFERNGTVFSFNWIPLGGFVRPAGEDDPTVVGGLASASKMARFTVLVAGGLANFIAAFLLFWLAFAITEFPVDVAFVDVNQGSPAELAGLQANDRIEQVNGVVAKSIDDVVTAVQTSAGNPITFDIIRAGTSQTIIVQPDMNENAPHIGVTIGFDETGRTVRYGLVESATESVRQIWEIITLTLRVPIMLIKGQVDVGDVGFVGPPGIAKGIRESAAASYETGEWYRFLSFVAFINVALGFTNLLPIPALDGGRIMFVLIEALRGKRIEPEREALVHIISMVFLLGLMALIFVNDFINPFDFNFR